MMNPRTQTLSLEQLDAATGGFGPSDYTSEPLYDNGELVGSLNTARWEGNTYSQYVGMDGTPGLVLRDSGGQIDSFDGYLP